MAAMVRLQNKQAQTLNILLKDEKGKASTRTLLPRAMMDVEAGQLTEVVFNLVQRGHLAMNAVGMEEAKPVAPKVAAPVAAKAVKAFNGKKSSQKGW